jgi:hypothetical protein
VLPVLIEQPIPMPNPSRQEPVATRVNVPDLWNISEHEKDVTAFRKQIGVNTHEWETIQAFQSVSI